MTKYRDREIGPLVDKALGSMPVVALIGMRQTGKTTFLRNHPSLRERVYVTFDDFAHLEAAKSDPDRFVNQGVPMTIDEAHKCPELFSAIKRAVDLKRTPGQYLISGSANFLLLKSITDSLAGRSVYLTLFPFNRREVAGSIGKEPFIRTFFKEPQLPDPEACGPISHGEVLKGGMPPVCLGEVSSPDIWFKGYEQTYLERDVRDLTNIGDLIALRNLLHLIALRTGQVLSVSELGRDAKLSYHTTSRYLSVFEASFIVYRLLPYLNNRATRLIKSPKLYLEDSGLAAYLGGIYEPGETIGSERLFGAILETFVAQNLLSIVQSSWPSAKVFFWSVQGRHEVDFVIEVGNACIALEVKSGARWTKKDLAGLQAFLKATPTCKAAVLCHNGTQAVQLSARLWAIPIAQMLC